MIDGGYGPAPDNEGNVDLSYYATDYVEDCQNNIELPEGNKKYLDEVLTTGKYKVVNMSYMFRYCYPLTSLDVSNWDTSNVTNMSWMFSDCNSLTTLDLSNWDTSNVTSMGCMFFNCYELTSLDVSNWDTSNVTDMNSMFETCYALTSLDVSNFDTSNVTDMTYMFGYCNKLTTVTGIIDMSKVSSYNKMLYNTSKLQSINIKLPEDGSITEEQFLAQVTPASAKQAINFIGGGGESEQSPVEDEFQIALNKDESTYSYKVTSPSDASSLDCSIIASSGSNIFTWDITPDTKYDISIIIDNQNTQSEKAISLMNITIDINGVSQSTDYTVRNPSLVYFSFKKNS